MLGNSSSASVGSSGPYTAGGDRRPRGQSERDGARVLRQRLGGGRAPGSAARTSTRAAWWGCCKAPARSRRPTPSAPPPRAGARPSRAAWWAGRRGRSSTVTPPAQAPPRRTAASPVKRAAPRRRRRIGTRRRRAIPPARAGRARRRARCRRRRPTRASTRIGTSTSIRRRAGRKTRGVSGRRPTIRPWNSARRRRPAPQPQKPPTVTWSVSPAIIWESTAGGATRATSSTVKVAFSSTVDGGRGVHAAGAPAATRATRCPPRRSPSRRAACRRTRR